MTPEIVITEEVRQAIQTALRSGNTVELKVEHGRLVVIEIKRIVKIKHQL